MQFTGPIAFFLLISCYVGNVESQSDTVTLTVENGGTRGEWGERTDCPSGKAKGFSLKIQPKQGYFSDDTSLNGIRLICTDGSIITSAVGKYGTWNDEFLCPSGFLTSFSLRVSEEGHFSDNKAANNIKFKCTDESELEGNGHKWGKYGSWSESCKEDGICGIQTKVDFSKRFYLDNTGLNDVKFFCCT